MLLNFLLGNLKTTITVYFCLPALQDSLENYPVETSHKFLFKIHTRNPPQIRKDPYWESNSGGIQLSN